MDFLRMEIEDDEVLEDDQINTVAFSLYRFQPDYEWLVDLDGEYYSFFEYGKSKENKEAIMRFSYLYEHQIQCFRQYYYSLGVSVAGLSLMGQSAAVSIEQIMDRLSEQRACGLPELLTAKRIIEQEIHDTKSELSEAYLPYMLEYIKLLNHDERFFLLGLFAYGLEKRLALQKRFVPDFIEDKKLIEKLYSPLLAEKMIVSDLRHNHKWLLLA